ncbi:MAG: amylo-alpha-1,6-glucosidase [Actinobacteria bacterium]|nr:amylo-alpha-1,6-glucosidase [Actinomycetota bacterium]
MSPAEPNVSVTWGSDNPTAIAGLTFAISDDLGDFGPGQFGLIVRDTRHLSRLQLAIDGTPPRRLGFAALGAERLSFRAYVHPRPHLDPPLDIERRRLVVPDGMREDITLRWWAAEPAEVDVSLLIDCDFADIFQVRRTEDMEPDAPPNTRRLTTPWRAVFEGPGGDRRTSIRFSRPARDGISGGLRWRARLDRSGAWQLRLYVRADGPGWNGAVRLGTRSRADPVTVTSDPPLLGDACARSLRDLDRLSLPDTMQPSRRLLAAGIPWFVALFGRDSLIASYQARAFTPNRIVDTLRALAARQGAVVNRGNGEEPGKILHEVRLSEQPWLGTGTTSGRRPYYGSVDATPLFVILYGVAWRWGVGRDVIQELLPTARKAIQWLRRHGDPDGDGLIEYRASPGHQLGNQGWKDSENAIQFRDGSLANGPIAVVEAQGYAYRARKELAAIVAWLGFDAEASDLDHEADEVRRRIREAFWRPGGEGDADGYFALALDGDKRPVNAIASNMGHLLWCGVPTNEQAEAVARHLTSPALASGWGVRTLATDMDGYNPLSYHLGSVWPHDTAICVDGLRRYGLQREAALLMGALVAAMAPFDGQMPELFGGHAREDQRVPVPYPSACRPQAWAAGVPLAMVSTMLGIEPFVPGSRVLLNPVLPPSVRRLDVRGLSFPSGRLSVEVDHTSVRVTEAPDGFSVEFASRPIL